MVAAAQAPGEEERFVPTFALAIPHTPWVPERVESVNRLMGELFSGGGEPPGLVAWTQITERARNEVWSERMWLWGTSTGASHFLSLQDDVLVAPGFWAALRALVETNPEDVIGLEVAHPMARQLAEEDVRLFTTPDMLIGVGYVIPVKLLEEFLVWREEHLVAGWKTSGPGGKTALTEDTMIGIWCLATGRRILHPIPTIIDHDVELASTYGNDDHTNRRPYVNWKDAAEHADQYGPRWDDETLAAPGWWLGRMRRARHAAPDGGSLGVRYAYSNDPAILTGRAPIPHLGRFYEASPPLARQWVKGFTDRQYLRAKQDDGAPEKRRLWHLQMAKAPRAKKAARVLICTPTRGGTDPRYAASLMMLVRLVDVDVDSGFELLDTWLWHEDVVRVRSRFVRAFLETDATHLYFRDADVVAPPHILRPMIGANREFVACPYPRREGIRWDRVRTAILAGDERLPEMVAYDWSLMLLGPELAIDAQNCAEVASMPLGCALLRRDMLERMTETFARVDAERVNLEPLRDRQKLEAMRRKELETTIRQLCTEVSRWRAGHMGLVFDDLERGRPVKTVALFQLLVRASQSAHPLHSEDASFCARWRDLGGKVWAYLGPGSPVDHAGDHVFRGYLEAFDLRRVSPEQARKARELEALARQAPPKPLEELTTEEAERFGADPPEDPSREPQEPAAP
jgi:hypothetical protein